MYCMTSRNIHGFAENGYYFQRTGGRPLSSKLHSHDFYEFLFIVSGKCTHERNKIEENLSKGDLIILSPGVAHRFISQDENTDVIALSVFSHEMKSFFDMYRMGCFPEKSFILNLSVQKQSILLERCEMIAYESNEDFICRLRMLLGQIFLFATEIETKNKNVPPEIARILNEMKKIENAAVGIEKFLRLSGYSHSQLCRLTKKYIGITPTEYINQTRMNYAYDMIVHGDESYETICEKVGFESFSYFSKMLKKYFGCSAAKLRKGNEIIRSTI